MQTSELGPLTNFANLANRTLIPPGEARAWIEKQLAFPNVTIPDELRLSGMTVICWRVRKVSFRVSSIACVWRTDLAFPVRLGEDGTSYEAFRHYNVC